MVVEVGVDEDGIDPTRGSQIAVLVRPLNTEQLSTRILTFPHTHGVDKQAENHSDTLHQRKYDFYAL